MKNPYFGRLMTAMVTLMTANGAVDVAGTTSFAKWLLSHGSDSVLVCGTTGESPTISVAEKRELFASIIREVAGSAPVICGTGTNSTQATIELTQMAERVGAAGALVVGPYYNKPTQEGFYQHFKAVANATKLPIIVYNVPGRTGTNIAPQTVLRLAQDCPNIVAIKEAAGNVAQVAELYRIMPRDFTIYSGDDGLILPFMAVGATGLISVLSNLGGKMLNAVMDAYEAGDVAQARELNSVMMQQAAAMFVVSNPIPVKEAVTLCTPFNAGPLRLPLCPMDEASRQKMVAILKQTGLMQE